MKQFLLVTLSMFLFLPLKAQVGKDDFEKMKKESQDQYEAFKTKGNQEYKSFRQKANAEYARFMEEAWKSYDLKDADEMPMKPKPVELFEAIPPVTNSEILYDDVEVMPSANEGKPEEHDDAGFESETPSRPEPMEPILPVFESDVTAQSLFLYGSSFPVKMEKKKKESRLKLKNVSERSVARMWKKLSTPYYDNIVAECLQQREDRNLCDWAYIKLAEKMSQKYFDAGSNEAVVLQMYLLTQSGYQMRIARVEDKLTLLIGSKEKIFRYKYFVKDGIQFYLLDKSQQYKSMDVFDCAFPGEKSMSLAVSQPSFDVAKTSPKTLTAKHYPSLSVPVATNRNLISFYDDYPMTCQWGYYSKASLSPVVKGSLYPAIQEAIKDKTELEAVGIILDFVQTAFSYSTDQQQFGYERPLYPDEPFYYLSCDCEDRAILFSCLVRELVGLDVVLLDYPSHITTAVRFNEDVEGDYLTIDDQKYVICEPTFTQGAPVGRCPEKYKTQKPKVIKI